MGFRTVVILSNDYAHQWETDTQLGRKISQAASNRLVKDGSGFQYGSIVEVVHADAESLVHISSLNSKVVAQEYWRPGKTTEQYEIELLNRLAKKHKFNLVAE